MVVGLMQLAGGGETVSSHTITSTPGVPQFHVEIDKIPDGNTFCNPVDTASVELLGGSYRVAVCVTALPAGVASFAFDLVYDDTLNQAPEVADSGTALDDNPDANATEGTPVPGTNVWPAVGTGDNLGTGWDCTGFGYAYPTADTDPLTGPGHGRATIKCYSLFGPFTLGDNETAGVLATVQFNVIGTGADTLHLESVVIGEEQGELGSCNEPVVIPIPCFDATDDKTTPTPTPTPTYTPTVAVTAVGVGGIAELPPLAGASADEAGAPSRGSGWSADNYAHLAGGLAAAAVVFSAGAWYYARRRFSRS